MEHWSQTSERDDARGVAGTAAAAVTITAGLWIWLEAVQVALGGDTPLVLQGFPVVRDVLAQVLRALFAVAVAALATRALDVSNPLEWLGVRRPVGREWGYVPLGLVLMVATLLGVNVLINGVLGVERTVSGSTLTDPVLRSRVVTLLVLVGPAEELVFRGVVQRTLRDVIGPWPAILVAGGLFGFGHVHLSATAPGDLLWLVGLTGLGVVLGWLYERTENLVVPALAHGSFNSLTTALPLLLG